MSEPTAEIDKIADDLAIFIRSLDEPARYVSHEEMKRVILKSFAQACALQKGEK